MRTEEFPFCYLLEFIRGCGDDEHLDILVVNVVPTVPNVVGIVECVVRF